jgi:iron complex transport system permease protein
VIDFGYRTLPVRAGRVSFRVPVRLTVVSVLATAVAAALAVASLRFGDFPMTMGDVVAAATGTGDEFHRLVLFEWRLPVALAALTFGAVLAVGGAIFQSLTRNPLGSPDVIGFDAGAYTAVVVTILAFSTRDYWWLAGAAVVGGLLTALAVYLLSWRGGVQGFRLIVVGIAVAAMLGSVNSYLITRAESEDAMAVGFWSAGSIRRVSWESMTPALLLIAVIMLAAALLAPALRRLELGDDVAVTHGTRVDAARLALIVVGVATTALVTAAAGPLSFVALVAPQVARRLTRSPGVSLLAAASVGAMLLCAAYLVSSLIPAEYASVPVGLVTVCLGGTYLIWLLIRETRRYRVVPS